MANCKNSLESGDPIKKLLLAGKALSDGRILNFVTVFNLEMSQIETIKVFDSKCDLSCLSYGPFDNGPILLGTSHGHLLSFAYNSSLEK